MASFRCYDNSDVIVTIIITNFHFYLIQLCWKFSQIFVNGDVIHAQISEVLTLQNPIEPPYATNTTTGSENAVKKMNLRSFKLYRVYLNILNFSKVGDFF